MPSPRATAAALSKLVNATRGAQGPVIDTLLSGAGATALGQALGLKKLPSFPGPVRFLSSPWQWTKGRVGGPVIALAAGKGSGVSVRDRAVLGYLAGRKYNDLQNMKRYLDSTKPLREQNRSAALAALLAAGGGGALGAAVADDE